jgi:hypothetical protein
MATGRCAGCGCTGSVCKIGSHVMTCPQYIELYQHDPARCLDPAAEYQRYRTDEDTSEARARRRHLRLADSYIDLERRQALQATRWRKPKDILED